MCPHTLQGGFDLPVRLFPGQVGMYDAVVVVDGGVPDGPSNPPVVAFLGPGRPRPAYPPVVAFLGARGATERQQELRPILLYGKCSIQALQCVVGV